MKNNEYTFENFLVGDSNKSAYEAAIEVSNNPSGLYNPLYIYSKSGLGKTHLLLAIEQSLKTNHKDLNVRYIDAKDFVSGLIESIKADTHYEFYNDYKSVNVLLFDNIQVMSGKERTLEEFFNIIDLFINKYKKQLIITCDVYPRMLDHFTNKIISRFKEGLIVEIETPDSKLGKAIAENEMKQIGCSVSDDVVNAIANSGIDNIRQIKGMVKKAISMRDDCDIKKIINLYISNQFCDYKIVLDGSGYSVGLKGDGTIVVLGGGRYGNSFLEQITAVYHDFKIVFKDASDLINLIHDGTIFISKGYAESDYSVIEINRILIDFTKCIAVERAAEHTIGLNKDGTVIAFGDNREGQCNVNDWENIIKIAVNDSFTAGLQEDGKVVATGYLYNEYAYKDWNDIISISAGHSHILGLKNDGSVLYSGSGDKQNKEIEKWRNIIAISAGSFFSLGLESVGTVVFCGNPEYGEDEIRDWEDIVDIAAGMFHSVGLKKDGTVVAVGCNNHGQCNVGDWTDIVSISASSENTYGTKKDGSFIFTGRDYCGVSIVKRF